MAIRRLYNMLSTIADHNQAVRNDRMTRLREAEADRVFESVVTAVTDLSVFVRVDGRSKRAVQATDQPLRAGQRVIVSQLADGTIVVYGSPTL